MENPNLLESKNENPKNHESHPKPSGETFLTSNKCVSEISNISNMQTHRKIESRIQVFCSIFQNADNYCIFALFMVFYGKSNFFIIEE